MSKGHTFKISLSLAVLLFTVGVGHLFAANTILWTEGFETYNTQSGQTYGSLDKNLTGGPNAAPNGSGNPWFGPNPSNGWVTKAMTNPLPVSELVTPHSGQFMMRGNRNASVWYNAWDNDVDYVNIAYRFNNGSAFKVGFAIDWWFYDIIGNNGTPPDGGPGNFGDWAAIEYRPNAPTNTDYTNNGNIGTYNSGVTAALGIGAYESQAGYNAHVYQVQVMGATDSGTFNNGWFNTNITRSKGWHHASIMVDRCGIATFSIDDIVVLTHAVVAPNGFNVFTTYELQVTPDTYNQSAYYDDISLAADLNPSPLADVDNDGDVDQEDFGRLQICYGQPATAAGCSCLNLDKTGASANVIDAADITAFENCATGPDVPFVKADHPDCPSL